MADMSIYQTADLVAAVGVVVLVYFLVVKPNYNVSVSAKGFLPGSSIGHKGERSDGAGGDVRIADPGVSGFSVGGYEPPVFMQSNSLVSVAQQKGIKKEAEGMRNNQGRYVEGMSKFDPSKLDASMSGM